MGAASKKLETSNKNVHAPVRRYWKTHPDYDSGIQDCFSLAQPASTFALTVSPSASAGKEGTGMRTNVVSEESIQPLTRAAHGSSQTKEQEKNNPTASIRTS